MYWLLVGVTPGLASRRLGLLWPAALGKSKTKFGLKFVYGFSAGVYNLTAVLLRLNCRTLL